MQLKALYAKVALDMNLSAAIVQETIPSGQPRYQNRIGWAVMSLTRARALARPARGTYSLTDRGRDLLAEGRPVTDTRLLSFQEYANWQAQSKQARSSSPEPSAVLPSDVAASPEEIIEAADLQLRAALEADLLDRLLAVDPYAFERLVLRVLEAMGYGKDGSLRGTSKSGDGGIDGIISQDPLGLDRIYLQAKRFSGGTVQPKDIQAFMGALSTSHGDRGVFITTSTFTHGARATAARGSFRIELIDGRQLVRLMVTYGVGVQPQFVTTVYKIDDDFFEDL
jgi:restriction system protein